MQLQGGPDFFGGPEDPRPFPPEPPLNWSGGFHGGILPPPYVSRGTDLAQGLLPSGVEPESHGVKKSVASDFTGLRLVDLGSVVAEKLLEVFPLRSKSKGRRSPKDIFPLPTSKSILAALFPSLDERGISG